MTTTTQPGSGPQNPGPQPDPHRPELALPAGACDAHCHIFGPTARYPYASERGFTPPEAPLADLRLPGDDRLDGVFDAVPAAWAGAAGAELLAALGAWL